MPISLSLKCSTLFVRIYHPQSRPCLLSHFSLRPETTINFFWGTPPKEAAEDQFGPSRQSAFSTSHRSRDFRPQRSMAAIVFCSPDGIPESSDDSVGAGTDWPIPACLSGRPDADRRPSTAVSDQRQTNIRVYPSRSLHYRTEDNAAAADDDDRQAAQEDGGAAAADVLTRHGGKPLYGQAARKGLATLSPPPGRKSGRCSW